MCLKFLHIEIITTMSHIYWSKMVVCPTQNVKFINHFHI